MKISGLFLTLALLIGGAASCAVHQTSADNSSAAEKNGEVNSVNTDDLTGETARTADNTAGKTSKPAAAAPYKQSVAGTYKFETYPANKEGYVNSLEVEDKGGGKLSVYVSASYVYDANGAETFKEASGSGTGALRGNTATVSLVEDGGSGEESPCKATIIFDGSQAAVKSADDCSFNVRVDGVYKKAVEAKKTAPAKTKPVAAKLREINFEKLNDFVNDLDKARVGERFVINYVPPVKIAKSSRADENGNRSYKGVHYLETADEDEGHSAGFLTSGQMLKSLQENHDTKPITLRVTAVLVQSDGEFDVYRASFVTKIEGLDGHGEVLWTATGTEPAKLKFRH